VQEVVLGLTERFRLYANDVEVSTTKSLNKILCCQHQFLIVICMLHLYVPEMFGSGVFVPLLKDKSGSVHDMDNYRAITLLPVISKSV